MANDSNSVVWETALRISGRPGYHIGMSPAERTAFIRETANTLGFARFGVAPAISLPRSDYVTAWLEANHCGEMDYLRRWHPMRMDARHLLPTARSVIVVADVYRQNTETSSTDRARVAQYAWGKDYHRVIRRKLKRLVTALRAEMPEPFETRICVDTAPLLEREVALLAGIGWIGKNTMVLHQDIGSFFFLGEVLTSLDLEPSAPVTDHCGTCTRCIDACPTQALQPYQMDATRCISYLTIEHRSEIPDELRRGMADWLYGCDICQDVCPFNRKPIFASDPDYQVRADHPLLPNPQPSAILELTLDQYDSAFQGSAIRRANLDMMKRNAAIVEDNLKRDASRPAQVKTSDGAAS